MTHALIVIVLIIDIIAIYKIFYLIFPPTKEDYQSSISNTCKESKLAQKLWESEASAMIREISEIQEAFEIKEVFSGDNMEKLMKEPRAIDGHSLPVPSESKDRVPEGPYDLPELHPRSKELLDGYARKQKEKPNEG